MSDQIQNPQPSNPGDSQQPATSQAETSGDNQIEKLRRESAKYRTKSRDLEAEILALRQKSEAAERERLQSQGEFQKLYEQLKTEHDALRANYEQQTNSVRGRILTERIRAELAGAGISDTAKQSLLLPGLLESARAAEIAVADDWSVTGDVSAIVKSAVEAFSPPQPKSQSPAGVRALSAHVPRTSPDEQPLSVRWSEAMKKAISS